MLLNKLYGKGGRIGPSQVAALLRFGWPDSTVLGGRFRPFYALQITLYLDRP